MQLPQQPSPYSPTTRRYLNLLYLAIEASPGAQAVPDLPRIAAAGRFAQSSGADRFAAVAKFLRDITEQKRLAREVAAQQE